MKKTEKINDTVLKAVEKIARHEVEKNYFDWPPDCMGFFHQPKRPKNVKKKAAAYKGGGRGSQILSENLLVSSCQDQQNRI